MAATFSEAQVALDEIAARIQANSKRLTGASSTITQAEADLTAMASNYTAVVEAIDAAVALAPTDTAYVNLKAAKDKLVSEFQALKADATAMKNALAGV